MKRRTLKTVVILLSLLLASMPAHAKSAMRGLAGNAGAAKPLSTGFDSTLVDITNTCQRAFMKAISRAAKPNLPVLL